MTRYRARPGLTVRELPDGDAVVASDDGMEAVILNATGAAVLDMFASEASEDEVMRLFCESFPGENVAGIQRDVQAIIRSLVTSRILEPCGSASSTA